MNDTTQEQQSTHSEQLPTQRLNAKESIAIIAQKIDKQYQEGLQVYATSLSQYSVEIETLTAEVLSLKQEKKEEEKQLSTTLQKIYHQTELLHTLQEAFLQHIHTIDTHKTEYYDLIDTKEYRKILKRKQRELRITLDEIEELEILLLKEELRRINLLTTLTPKRYTIKQLKHRLKKLKLEKEHFLFTKLHQIPQLALQQGEIVATEVVDSVKPKS